MRRVLTILAVVIVLIGAAVPIYYFFFANTSGITVENGVSSGNPFGAPSDNATPSAQPSDTQDASTLIAGTQVAPHLLKITSAPVARGFLVLDPPKQKTGAPTADASSTSALPAGGPSVRYIDRQSGNMYAYDIAKGTSERLTNHTAPGVEEAAWVGDGSTAFIRFLTSDPDKSEHIDTYVLHADGSDGRFLARDLSSVVTLATSSVFTLLPSTSGSTGTLMKPDGSSPVSLFTSVLSSLAVSFSGQDLLAYTKPSRQANGYAFIVDRKSGSFSRIAGPLPALSATTNPQGTALLMSYLANGTPTMALLDLKTHAMTTLPVVTFAEKCVWAADGESAYCAVPVSLAAQDVPDSWYEGLTATTDRIWRIDLIARAATLIANLPNIAPKDPIDAVSLSIDKNDSVLTFMNKRDDTLWAFTF
jgi:hypothetical protein